MEIVVSPFPLLTKLSSHLITLHFTPSSFRQFAKWSLEWNYFRIQESEGRKRIEDENWVFRAKVQGSKMSESVLVQASGTKNLMIFSQTLTHAFFSIAELLFESLYFWIQSLSRVLIELRVSLNYFQDIPFLTIKSVYLLLVPWKPNNINFRPFPWSFPHFLFVLPSRDNPRRGAFPTKLFNHLLRRKLSSRFVMYHFKDGIKIASWNW